MSVKALIRENIILNTNPDNLKSNLEKQFKEVKNLDLISSKPINVLVIGGSSGYGLASRVALAEKANAKIVNVSSDRKPRGKRPGPPSYYNNLYFNGLYKNNIDISGDGFSLEIKEEVIDYYQKNNEKIDLVIYSLASGKRVDPTTNTAYISALKPTKKDYVGINVDLAKDVLKEETLTKASQKEIEDTIKVMGGEDYLIWANMLKSAGVLNNDVKFVAYSYVGPELTHDIYKDGTIGLAKRDLEAKNDEINELLKSLNGKAYISNSKAVVTKASIFIPTMALYASALFKVMKKHNVHESITMHKYRLFKDFIFNDYNETTIPLDSFEMDEKIQNEVSDILSNVTQDNFKELVDFEVFKKEYLALNGF